MNQCLVINVFGIAFGGPGWKYQVLKWEFLLGGEMESLLRLPIRVIFVRSGVTLLLKKLV